MNLIQKYSHISPQNPSSLGVCVVEKAKNPVSNAICMQLVVLTVLQYLKVVSLIFQHPAVDSTTRCRIYRKIAQGFFVTGMSLGFFAKEPDLPYVLSVGLGVSGPAVIKAFLS